MDVDSDSSSSSDSIDEELEQFKQDELKKKIDALENKVKFAAHFNILSRKLILLKIFNYEVAKFVIINDCFMIYYFLSCNI